LIFSDEEEEEKEVQDSNGEYKEELSSEFNVEISVPPPQRGKNFRQMAQFQLDFESDEDILESDEVNLLE
jgi:hypothetical protein